MPANVRLWFSLEGVTALLMHSPSSMKAVEAGKLGRKVIPTAEDEAKASRYVLPDGNLYIPAIGVRNCLLRGARGFRLSGTRRSAPDALAGAIGMGDEAFPLLDGEGNVMAADHYTIDIRRVNIQRNAVLRARARIELPWGLRCNFPFNSDLVALDVIRSVLDNAGEMVGLLDYRPDKKGWFGKFRLGEVWTAEL